MGVRLTNDIEVSAIIFSGGDAAHINISEAQAMKSFLDDNCNFNIQQTKILIEDESNNTLENALCCLKYLDKQECLHLVTNEFHVPRAKLLFEHIVQVVNSINCIIHCHAADSKLEKTGRYRPKECRPVDQRQWRLSEVLDFEWNRIRSINNMLGRYKLQPICNDRIEQAIVELEMLDDSIRRIIASE